MLPSLRKVIDEAHQLVDDLHFDSEKTQHVVAGALLGRVLEVAEGIYSTLEREDSGCGFILLRSLTETYVDLLNTANDPAYSEFMEAAFVEQQHKVIAKSFSKGGTSSGLSGFSGGEAVDQLNWTRARLKELGERKIKPLTIRERFERAGQSTLYDIIYVQLCWHSHANINILGNRHVRATNAGVEIRAFVPVDDVDLQKISGTTAGILVHCIGALKELLTGGMHSGDLEKLTSALGSLRELWGKNTQVEPA